LIQVREVIPFLEWAMKVVEKYFEKDNKDEGSTWNQAGAEFEYTRSYETIPCWVWRVYARKVATNERYPTLDWIDPQSQLTQSNTL